MMKLENGTTVRNTPRGTVATKGKRELHLLGASASAAAKAEALLAAHSFNKLFTAAKRAPRMMGANVRLIRL